MVESPGEIPAAADLGRVHLMGIGGAGMSGIARILLARGGSVSGCDAKESAALAALRALGAEIAVGHDPSHADAADTVVVSSAIRAGNPELQRAREVGRLVLPRAAVLASVMADRIGLAVAGTHGKTTTTSMLTVAMHACGLDPSYAIGGDLNEPGSNAHHGHGEYFVAEADESDRSFLLLSPRGAVITNVEPDHLDNYGDAGAVGAAFEDFVRRIDVGGPLLLGADDPGSLALVDLARDRGLDVRTFGLASAADVRVDDLQVNGSGSSFDLVAGGRRLGRVELAVPGAFNAVNAAGALGLGLAVGLPFADLARGLAGFSGARRRFELKGIARGVRVFDDYAHHPTEVARGALVAARAAARDGRVIAVFQPHLYSRTEAFAADFGAALGGADVVVVMEVYAAREDPLPGVTGGLIASAVPLPPERVYFEPSWAAVPGLVAGLAEPGDVIVTIGAGDVTMLGPALLDELSR
ncbi:MAG TPA: UDP-N-acetylmuramate--L-alanine ligase [Mycobacteriales bacterium]|jgi:UDP-N-acetylmuramate--alanine ligase|nr:UDP-N-acetylmuramate--L-alanine ligase [Mycobacteriales bacterium]HVX69003.1 UDP-N-acetylmuramate--L-alanine ligase [Mycobacteriales bacterium]